MTTSHAARAASGRFGAYLEAALDAVVVADASGCVVEFNPAAERIFGYSRDEALGRTLAELIVPPSLRERHLRAFARFVETGEARLLGRRIELTGMRADGSEFPVELALSRVEGEPLLICGAVRDLSDAKRAADDLRKLAEEQAALRRLAMLVARQPSPDEVFTAVTEEVGSVLDADFAAMLTFDDDQTVTLIASWSAAGSGPSIGTRLPLDGDSVAARIYDTGTPARMDSYADVEGETARFARDLRVRSTVGAPILVDGKLWGALLAATREREPQPETAEARIAAFSELVSTTISNAEARHELQRVGAEQEALRRAATLVASGASPTEVFTAITASAAEVFGVPFASLIRVGPDETATMVAGSAVSSAWVGTAWTVPPDDPGITRTVLDSVQPSRIEDHSRVHGPLGEAARALDVGSVVGAPVVVDGSVWGVLAVGAAQNGPPLAPDAADRLADFAELVSTAIVNSEARDQVRRLLDEQAALRRVATLVARGVSPAEIFAAVTDEVGALFGSEAAVARFEPDGSAMVVGLTKGMPVVSIGTRWPFEDFLASTTVYRTGRPARSDHTGYRNASGSVAEDLRKVNFVSTVAAPIVVEGDLWGVMTVSDKREPLPPDTEERVAKFTGLVATALADAESRAELAASEARARALAEEQAALRRVATLVAGGAAPDQFFSVVAREVAGVLNVPGVIVTRYEADGMAVVFGEAFDSELSGAEAFFGVGSRAPKDPGSLAAQVFETHGAARIDDFSTLAGTVGDLARAAGFGCGCAGPIVVNGELWGKMCVFSGTGTVLPPGTEDRLHAFIELVVTAIANYEARAELAASEAHARELANEQAALRRVATLAARESSPVEVFEAVAEEAARVLEVDAIGMLRFESDETATFVAQSETPWDPPPLGTRFTLEGENIIASVHRTGQAARMDDWESATGSVAAMANVLGVRSAVASPIVVEGRLWGTMIAATNQSKPLPADTESRIVEFTELLATSIANAESREALSRLATEQAALRRVATLVAQGAEPGQVFAAVAEEVAGIINTPIVAVFRYESDGTCTTLGVAGESSFVVGNRWPVEEEGISGMILASGRPARKDDYSTIGGPVGEAVREALIVATVGVPIVVEGSIWGFMVAAGRHDRPIPTDTEERLARFTELVATAVSNATMRGELVASRARVIVAADDARRRIEHDLHDGAQQQLV
ncbi:MAG TPA: GAF domain-containing protein, partial [Gaiellaceae bacterium]|nr:GAF domain-containing protein [Gaiellaceae bacterium]